MDPLFSAVSTSAKQLWALLRCIGFSQKAQVCIGNDGIRFTVEESQVMQGLATHWIMWHLINRYKAPSS